MKPGARLAKLIDAHLAQRLDAVGRFELEEMLRDDAAARREFWKRAEMEGLLREWGRAQEGLVHDFAKPQPGWGKAPWLKQAAGIAALVALAALFWLYQSGRGLRPARNDSVAVLTQVSEARWRAGSAMLEPGQFIGTGDLELESGWAVLEFVSGNEVMIGGPAKVHISSANEIECEEGSLTIHQPTRSARFQVHTPSAVIEDIYETVAMKVRAEGTGLLVDKDGRASRRLENGGSSPVPGGEALRIGRDGTVGDLAGLKDEFTRQLQLCERLRAVGRALPAHWLATSKRQNGLPGLLLRYTFDDVSPDLLRVPNQAANSGGELDGTIGGGAIREGRWPYKKALEMERRFDGVRLSVPEMHEAITMTAWIRIDGLDHKLNGIFLSDGIKPGGFHWQILNTGELNCGLTGKPYKYSVYLSPPVVTPASFGKWQHVAVVYDMPGKSLSHYLNGQLVSRHELKQATAVQIREGMLGNWDPRDDKDADMIRNFHGRIDDFAIYQKALSGEEIRSLYEDGRN